MSIKELTNIKKLDENQERQTEILANRIMPKTDFVKVIEHDKIYWNTLNEQFEFNVIKADILGEKCQKVIKNQTKKMIKENIDLLCEWANTKVLCLDLKGKLKIQEKLINDKETHFKNVFLPQFEKESKEAQENWEKTYKEVKEVLSTEKDKEFKGLFEKINFELKWWEKVDKKNKKNEEFIIQIYKPLKRLLGVYHKAKEEKEEEKMYQ